MERTTRFTILLHLPDGHDAGHVQQDIIDRIRELPKLLRNSLTWDRGAELALHKRITAALTCRCTSATRIPRGSAARTRTPTGCCASTSPKGTDLSVYPEDYLNAVAEELNDRPRKTLRFMKPSERIIELLDAVD